MAVKKATWLGSGTLRALAIPRGRTKTVHSSLLTGAVLRLHGAHLIIQDARTGQIEYQGHAVSDADALGIKGVTGYHPRARRPERARVRAIPRAQSKPGTKLEPTPERPTTERPEPEPTRPEMPPTHTIPEPDPTRPNTTRPPVDPPVDPPTGEPTEIVSDGHEDVSDDVLSIAELMDLYTLEGLKEVADLNGVVCTGNKRKIATRLVMVTDLKLPETVEDVDPLEDL